MISPQYVDGLELRIEELASELRCHKAALAGLQQERDALAALCQEGAAVLERTANDTLDGRNMAVRLREANTTSLTRLKAEWQAEARLEFAKDAARRHGGLTSIVELAESINYWRPIEEKAELRRQAEGDKS